MPFIPPEPLSPEEEDRIRQEEIDQEWLAYRLSSYSPTSPLHENLRALRISRKLKKQEMADLMGITPRTYYTYENGARPVPSDALVRLATMIDVDLDLLLMGRSLRPTPQIIESALDDFLAVIRYLNSKYPTMDGKTQIEVARHAVTGDPGDWSRTDPEIIRGSVSALTRYKFHPEDLPSPPNPDYYRDDEWPHKYEQDMAAWQAIVDEDFGEDP